MFLRTLLFVVFLVTVARSTPPPPAPVLERLVAGNDELIARARAASAAPAGGAGGTAGIGTRGESVRLLVYVCGFVAPSSRYHRDPTLVPELDRVVAGLESAQYPSGLFDAGNLESPPDTGFMLEAMAKAQLLLIRDGSAATAALRERLKAVLIRAAQGVAAGGVHTPNHRWGVCAALALAHRLYPDPRYKDRIAEWLAEGIDLDADGQYAERSPAYSAKVVNPALLTLAGELQRPPLLEPVRRNLALTWHLTEATGEVVTLASRRQDQRAGARVSISEYYLPARWLARHDRDGRWSALAAWIEESFLDELVAGAFDPNWPLPFLLENPELAGPLPPATPLPVTYSVTWPLTGLARIRNGSTSATVYGGSDAGAGFGAASGLAMNPTFFALRKGASAVSLRLTPSFFGTGFFYSQGIEKTGEGWRLHETRRIPYHQPLPPEHRRPDGQYPLSADGRFFSKLDFAHRPKDYRTLETSVRVSMRGDDFILAIDVDGHPGVPVTIELAFTGEGNVEGAIPLAEVATGVRGGSSWLRRGAGGGGPAGAAGAGRQAADLAGAFVLKEGTGRFVGAGGTIEFGPGAFKGSPGRMEGEDYTWVGGSLRAEGQRVYLTAVTPFHHELVLK